MNSSYMKDIEMNGIALVIQVMKQAYETEMKDSGLYILDNDFREQVQHDLNAFDDFIVKLQSNYKTRKPCVK